MSLDVYLKRKRDPTEADKAIALLQENGLEQFAFEIECRHDCGDEVLYEANYTHNCGRMAGQAGLYELVWHPDRIGVTKASQVIAPLKDGIEFMRANPEKFIALNPENGWGSYDTFLPWLERYLQACIEYPDADVKTST